jgi:hypothetical protein
MRLGGGLRPRPSRPSALHRYGAAGGVEQHHVIAAELGCHRALGDLDRALALDDRQGVDLRFARPGFSAAPSRPDGGCRARPSAPSSSRAGTGAWRSWRWLWSYRSPAGRPSGSDRRRWHSDQSSGRPQPSISTSSSWTILMTCWPGVTDLTTSTPTARARTLSVKGAHDLGSATSASISARRISRSASLTSFSDSAPRPVSLSKTLYTFAGPGRRIEMSVTHMEFAGLCRKGGRESRKAADFWSSISARCNRLPFRHSSGAGQRNTTQTKRPMAPKQQNGSRITPGAAL